MTAMFTVEQARTVLETAGVFYYNNLEAETKEIMAYSSIDKDGKEFWTDEAKQELIAEVAESQQVLNQNDTWGWALAWGEKVADEELPEVAELFYRYGSAGILYWVSKKNNWMRSEFKDINRFVDFVKHEEKLRASSKRAYKFLKYVLGGDDA